MKRTLLIGAVVATVAVGAFAVLPSAAVEVGPVIAGVEQAQAQSVERSGDRAADLMSEIIGPILIILIGAFSLVAMARREVGLALSAALVGLISGLFVFTPQVAQDVFEGVYKSVF
jgi:hypothetical protein